jgi:uncharacterized membrane protein
MGEFEILDTDEPLPRRIERHAFDRLIMLSDGVFAIAITLLALEIRPPAHWNGAMGSLWRLMWPTLGAYCVSFAVVGVYWAAHKRIFARVRRVDGGLTALTLVLLGLVALLPAASMLIYSYGPRGAALRVYFGLIVLIGLSQTALWGYAALWAKLIDPSISRGYRVAQLVASLVMPVLGCAGSLYATTSSSSYSSVFALLFIAALIGLRRWMDRKFPA